MDARSPSLPTDSLPNASGWRRNAASTLSLPEVNGTIFVPTGGLWWRRLLAFAGPGYLISVGYMDPGNWATDLAGGSKFGYTLLSVILLWLACEAAIIACDLAEVIGTAIALKLLFGIPLIGGALIAALDAFLLLLLMNKGFRFLEAFVIAMLIVIAVCFGIQIVA